MSLGNRGEREDSLPEDIAYNEFMRVVRKQNKPKYGWRENGVVSIQDFNRLKTAEDRVEYREIWREIKQERREKHNEKWDRRRNHQQ